MRHPKVTRHCPKPFSLNLGDHLRPALLGDARPFRYYCLPTNPSAPSRVEQSLGIHEGNQRESDNIYLAEAIPVASANSFRIEAA
jgi:hypothetical protein